MGARFELAFQQSRTKVFETWQLSHSCTPPFDFTQGKPFRQVQGKSLVHPDRIERSSELPQSPILSVELWVLG